MSKMPFLFKVVYLKSAAREGILDGGICHDRPQTFPCLVGGTFDLWVMVAHSNLFSHVFCASCP